MLTGNWGAGFRVAPVDLTKPPTFELSENRTFNLISLLDYHGGIFTATAESLEAAKALYQSNHEQRIRALLKDDDGD